MSKVKMGAQSDHESGFFEGDECVDDDEIEIIHEEINNPGGMLKPKGKVLLKISPYIFCFIYKLLY